MAQLPLSQSIHMPPLISSDVPVIQLDAGENREQCGLRNVLGIAMRDRAVQWHSPSGAWLLVTFAHIAVSTGPGASVLA